MDNSQDIFCHKITESITNNKRVRMGVLNRFEKALSTYVLLSENDRILVPVGNNADSVLLALLFREKRLHSEISFDLVFVNENELRSFPSSRFTQDYASFLGVEAPAERGISIPLLIDKARENECNKAALYDIYNDTVVTAPKETVPGEPAVQLIRPMRLIHAEDIEFWNSHTGLNLPFGF